MKKSLFALTTAAIILSGLTFISCESTKTQPAPQQIYEDDEVSDVIEDAVSVSDNSDTAVTELNIESEIESESESDSYDEAEPVYIQQPKEKKALISFGNKEKFILTEEMSVYLHTSLGKYTQKGGTYTIEPKEKTAGFGSPYLLGYYIVQFDEEGRKYFTQSLASYLKEFEDKKLIRKSNKTYRQYGMKEAKIWWGSIKTSTPNNSVVKCCFGYEFHDGSPYFCLTLLSGVNQYFIDMREDRDFAEPNSPELKYYFTKAQAKALAAHLAPEYVDRIFVEYELAQTGGAIMEADEY